MEYLLQKATADTEITALIKKIMDAIYAANNTHGIEIYSPEYVDLEFIYLISASAISRTSTRLTPATTVETTDTETPGDVTTTDTPGDVTTTDVDDSYQVVRTTDHGNQRVTTQDSGEDIVSRDNRWELFS